MPKRQSDVYRRVFIAWYGDLPLPCRFCTESVTKWGKATMSGVIHHIDWDFTNNDPANLAVAHTLCHTRHHTAGRKMSPESGDKKRRAMLRRSICPDCGGEFNPIWMTRHVREGKCTNPTEEQVAEGARQVSVNSTSAQRQWAEGRGSSYERTPEIRARIASSLTGRKQSPESNALRSASLKRAYAEGRHVRPTSRRPV